MKWLVNCCGIRGISHNDGNGNSTWATSHQPIGLLIIFPITVGDVVMNFHSFQHMYPFCFLEKIVCTGNTGGISLLRYLISNLLR